MSVLTIDLNSPTRSFRAAASRSVSCAAPCRRLRLLERVVEALAADLHHDPPEHLDEAPVGVPAEPLVVGQPDHALQGLLVQAEVQDRVHHPGHRELAPGADAHEQRVGRIAEALAGPPLDFLDGLEDVVPQPVGQPLAGGEVVVAGLGRDREPGRRRQPGDRHLGEPGALAAEQVAHLRVALGGRPHPRRRCTAWPPCARGRPARSRSSSCVRIVASRFGGPGCGWVPARRAVDRGCGRCGRVSGRAAPRACTPLVTVRGPGAALHVARPGRDLGPSGCTELGEDVLDVRARGLRCDPELLGDLARWSCPR